MLIREVLPPNRQWLYRLWLGIITFAATATFWSMLCLAMASGCWRGNGPLPTCPNGQVATGDGGGGQQCLPRVARTKIKIVPCDRLEQVVGEIPGEVNYDTCYDGTWELLDWCRYGKAYNEASVLRDWIGRATMICLP